MPQKLRLGLLAAAVLLHGCSIYQAYGFGRVANSRLAASEVTTVRLPSNAPSISQRFRPVIAVADADHRGFDIFVPSRTPVLAAAAGTVERVSRSLLYGRQLMLNHGHGDAGFQIQTRYFHLAEQLVEKDQQVARGQLLGYSGLSGMAGLYPHLHFEVHRLNDAVPPLAVKYLDPQLFWVDGRGQVTCFDRRRDYVDQPTRLTYPVPCRDIPWN